jgi:hypothetical protein
MSYEQERNRAWIPEAVKVPTIWVITATLLALQVTGVTDWSPWVIAGPALVLIGVIVIAASRLILIGLYRGWKIKIFNWMAPRGKGG